MKNRTLLMIPGPIEFEPAVLAALGAPTTSHIAPNFIEEFGQALERTAPGLPVRPTASRSSSPARARWRWTWPAANLIEPGDRALVVNTGYFGDRMGAMLERYGAQVEHVRAAVGGVPAWQRGRCGAARDSYKLVTVTHVDTSTGVLADVRRWPRLAQRTARWSSWTASAPWAAKSCAWPSGAWTWR